MICLMSNFFWCFFSFRFIRIWDFISIFYLIVRDYTYQCGNPGSKSRGSEFYISELLCFDSKLEIWTSFDISVFYNVLAYFDLHILNLWNLHEISIMEKDGLKYNKMILSIAWNIIFVNYWKVHIMKISDMGSGVFILIKEVHRKMINRWAFHDIPGPGKYGLCCNYLQ